MKRILLVVISAVLAIGGCGSHNSAAPAYEPTVNYCYEGKNGAWSAEFQAQLIPDSSQQTVADSVKKYGHNYKLLLTYQGELEDLRSYKTIEIFCDTGLEQFGQSFTYTEYIEETEFTLQSNQPPGGAHVNEYSDIKVEITLDDKENFEIELVNTDTNTSE